MALDPLEPVVIQTMSATRTTKIITAVSATVISVTMVATAIFIMLANDKDFQKSHGLDTRQKVPAQISGSEKSDSALPGGGIATGKGGDRKSVV